MYRTACRAVAEDYDGGVHHFEVGRFAKRFLKKVAIKIIKKIVTNTISLITKILSMKVRVLKMLFQQQHKHHKLHPYLELQHEFEGQPELWHLHALLIAILRRTDPPPPATALIR